MRKTRIFVDMDGVLAKWQSEASLEEIATPGYFKNVPVVESVRTTVKMLLDNDALEVFILSSVMANTSSMEGELPLS